ncbi:Lysine-specific demethylase 8 [Clydaea vesicula]|uniref:Lysine-specific demethylase 8 n=1 Tax=Clydaea vesicula TaxID=447962 RepID=A0AAD5TZ53_9FUNG|nr:Lysine-specific demethylase 8 [Clydaea vesicula]
MKKCSGSYIRACFIKSLYWICLSENGNTNWTLPVQDGLSGDLELQCLRLAIKELDLSILISGSPLLKFETHDLIHKLEQLIEKKEGLRSLNKNSVKNIFSELINKKIGNFDILKNKKNLKFPLQKEKIALSLEQFCFRVKMVEPVFIETFLKPIWNPKIFKIDNLLNKIGLDRTLTIEIGKQYTDEKNWTQKLMSFNEFLMKYMLPNENLKMEFKENSIFGNLQDSRTGYLAQYDLFEQIPALKEDFNIPDYCYCNDVSDQEEDDVLLNAWIGPEGTVSPLHTDPYHNIFTQVIGFKYIRLYHPNQSHLLYPFDSNSMLKNTSQVDILHPDLLSFPLFNKAKYVELTIGPGDMLYIPKGYWHFVKSLTPSFSISFWF